MGKLTGYSAATAPAATSLLYMVEDPGGSPATRKVEVGDLGGLMAPELCGGRLTLETGVAVSETDQTGKTTVYWTPFHHGYVTHWNGTVWTRWEFSELSLALGTKTDATNYDVFLWETGSALALIAGPAWSSATARGTGAGTTELEWWSGMWVNKVDIASGPAARCGRYLGTIRMTATTTTEDSREKRFVWNAHNRVTRLLKRTHTGTWSATSTAYTMANGNTANKVNAVVGLSRVSPVHLLLKVHYSGAGLSAVSNSIGIGEDSTGTIHASCVPGTAAYYDGGFSGTIAVGATAHLSVCPTLGSRSWSWLELSTGSLTANADQSALMGQFDC